MKYIVEVKYTNPAHEHVSLRRRVDTIKRVVEARSEAEAINRVANQQRSLGFFIKEAFIVKPKEVMNEGFDASPKAIAKMLVDKHGKNVTKKHIDDLEQSRDSHSGLDHEEIMKHVQKMTEEASKEGEGVMRGMRASLKSMDLRHGVDSDKRDAGYKVPSHIKAAQAKSDALSKVEKRPQAGTLAAMKKEEVEQIVVSEGVLRKGQKVHVFLNPEHDLQLPVDHPAPEFKEATVKKIKSKFEADLKHSDGLMHYGVFPWHVLTPKHYDELIKKNKIKTTKRKKINSVKEEVEQTDEAAADWKKSFDKVANKNLNKDTAAQKTYLDRYDNETMMKALADKDKGKDYVNYAKSGKSIKPNLPLYGEEVEYIEEKLTAADPASKWIHDFVHSDNPKFEGKSKKERISMALGAKYAANRAVKEEVEQIDERNQENAESKRKVLRQAGVQASIAGKVPFVGSALQMGRVAAKKLPSKGLAKAYRELPHPAPRVTEEVESVEEANMRFDPEAAARPKASDVKNFLNRDTDRRAGAASKKYIRRMTKLGGLGPNQTKKDTEAHMKAHFEEVEQTDEARKMSRAEWRIGTESEVDKNNKRIYDRLAKENPEKAAAFHDNLAKLKGKDNAKKAADPGATKVVNKKVETTAKPDSQADIKLNAKIPSKYLRNKHVKIHPEMTMSPDKMKRM